MTDAERRRSGRPLIGVGGVVLTEALDRVLLVQRGTQPALGKWSVPGGLVERGESLCDACQREILEETGVAVQLDPQPVKLIERVILDASGVIAYHFLIIDFWGRAAEEIPRAGSDVVQVKWAGVTEVPQLDTTEGLVEVIARARNVARGERPETPLLE